MRTPLRRLERHALQQDTSRWHMLLQSIPWLPATTRPLKLRLPVGGTYTSCARSSVRVHLGELQAELHAYSILPGASRKQMLVSRRALRSPRMRRPGSTPSLRLWSGTPC